MYSGATPKRRRLEQSVIPKAKIKAIQELSVGFIIDSNVPFTIFEHSFLRKIFNHFDKELVVQMAWSGSPITEGYSGSLRRSKIPSKQSSVTP